MRDARLTGRYPTLTVVHSAPRLSPYIAAVRSSRWKSNQIAIDSGILTPNEVRQQEGWNPIPGGDTLRVKVASAPAIAA